MKNNAKHWNKTHYTTNPEKMLEMIWKWSNCVTML